MNTIKNLKSMPYAQAKVITTEKTVCLVSYTTTVVGIDLIEGWVYCYGTYSQTTRKHISAFCREFGQGLDYYLMKRIYAEGLRYNYLTGEVEAI